MPLGFSYLEGEGVIKNDQEAYVWIALAAAQGDEQVNALLDKLETELTPKKFLMHKNAQSYDTKAS
jgi:TPR repeat protein